jgi:hypothetical protein
MSEGCSSSVSEPHVDVEETYVPLPDTAACLDRREGKWLSALLIDCEC